MPSLALPRSAYTSSPHGAGRGTSKCRPSAEDTRPAGDDHPRAATISAAATSINEGIGTFARDSSRCARGMALAAVSAARLIALSAGPAAATRGERPVDGGAYVESPVVSDQPGVAPVTDPDPVNPWGIAFGPTTPLWVAQDGSSTSTLYCTNPAPAKQPLVPTSTASSTSSTSTADVKSGW